MKRPAVVIVVSALMAACASKGPDITEVGSLPESDPAATTIMAPQASTQTESNGGTCTVEITGDWEASWTFEQSIYSVSSDYWTSEEVLRETVDALGEDIAGGSYEELVERGEPIITFLQVACTDPDNLLRSALVTHTNATKPADLPMGPGTYPIIGGVFDAAGSAGSVIAEFSTDGDEVYGTVPGTGELVIGVWDGQRIEGSFAFDVEELFVDQPKKLRVNATFAFICDGWGSAC